MEQTGHRPTGVKNQTGDRFSLLIQAVEQVRDYAIFMLDTTGHVMTWNLGAQRIKGYSKNEIIGRHFSIFYTEPDIKRAYPDYELKVAKETGRYEDEGWRVRKDGTTFWANVVITRLVDENGRLLGFSKVTRDLTERRKAEEKLRENEERMRLLIDSAKDYAICSLNPQGLITSWNEGARRIKGFEARDVLGKHFSIFYPQEDVNSGKCDYELREAALTGRFEDEGWRIRKDGTMFWANAVITAIRVNGKLIGFSKVTRDLTERKRAEEKLRRAYEELEHRVQARTEELARANETLKENEDQLKEAIKARDEFLSIASHELKTPITALKMQVQMLHRRVDPKTRRAPPSEETILKTIEVADRQVTRLTDLIDNLLDVARVRAGKLFFSFEEVDLVHVIKDIAERGADHMKEAGCEIKLFLPEKVVGSFDRFRMEQVLINLLTNAAKYAPGAPVEIRLEVSNGLARLSVTDHGPGIPKKNLESVFKRFERLDHTGKTGLGLGLFIVKQIVEGHGGKIRAESDHGTGAAFVLEVPLKRPSAPTAVEDLQSRRGSMTH